MICAYAVPVRVGYAKHEPPKPAASPSDQKKTEQAKRILKGWLCCNYRNWPYCPASQRNVDLLYDFRTDRDRGQYLIVQFFCPECYAK